MNPDKGLKKMSLRGNKTSQMVKKISSANNGFMVTKLDLKIVVLREVSQAEEEKYHMTSLIYGI